MSTLTHWKKLTNPNYLGAYSIEPGQDLVLTIKCCQNEMVAGPDGKKEECLVLHFQESGVKPMILNKTNAKTISKVHKTPYIEQWPGKQVQIYTASVSAFGTTTDALRIRDFAPQSKRIDTTEAILKLGQCETIEELKATFLSLSKAEQSDKQLKEYTETLKAKLK